MWVLGVELWLSSHAYPQSYPACSLKVSVGCYCVSVCVQACLPRCPLPMWRPQDTFMEQMLSFHLYVFSDVELRSTRLVQQVTLPPEPAH